MPEEAPPLPQPTAQGTFGKTPFAHLLVYLFERQLTGSIVLGAPDGRQTTMLLLEGQIAKVQVSEPIAYLSDVLLTRGSIDDAQYATAMSAFAIEQRLFGQILLEQGAIDEETLMAGLRDQAAQKLAYVASWPKGTTFAYYDAFDAIPNYGGDDLATVDPLSVVWSAISCSPSWDHVNAAMARTSGVTLRLAATADTSRLGFGPDETAFVAALRTAPASMLDLAATTGLDASHVQLVVYCLLVTKSVDLVAPSSSSVRPAPVAQVPAPVPAPAPSRPSVSPQRSQIPPATGSTPSISEAGRSVPPDAGSSPVARVQLRRQEQLTSGAAIEEHAPIVRIDGRIATPMSMPSSPPAQTLSNTASASVRPAPPPAITPPAHVSPPRVAPAPPAAAKPLGMPPLRPPPRPPNAPTQAAAPAASPPAAPKKDAPMTPELAALRQKIIDRAVGITKEDYFQMLGVSRDADRDQIQASYLALAKVWHPDRLPAALADVKDKCTRVFSHLSEANNTLTDPERRQHYMMLLKDGGATPDDQAEIAQVLEAATDFQKAEICLRRSDYAQAEQLAKKAHAADPKQAEYLALVAWLEAMKPEAQSLDATAQKISLLSEAIKLNGRCERAYFYRGMLYKRIKQDAAAIRDFKVAAELNPRNLDAVREVRIHTMRTQPGGGRTQPGLGKSPAKSIPPPSARGSIPPPSSRASVPPKAPEKGGLFGKLFKK